MTPTQRRLDALFTQREFLAPWTGTFHRDDLSALLAQQLGSPAALDDWQARGDTRGRAFPRTPLFHIVSGNTPHAAFQS
ncbi:MAG TPA: acyl-CoA reductase, partial [Luteolibacter sp.]